MSGRLCVAAVSLMSLSGAAISLMVDGQMRGSVARSGPLAGALQEFQFELGEGPCISAWDEGEPVVEPDLAAPAVVRWPLYAQACVEAGALAVFAYPLRLGATRLGVMDAYRDRVGGLDAEQHARGLVLADMAGHAVLALQAGAPPDSLPELLLGEPPHWAEVHQATGMVSVQLEVSLEEAFVRLRAHAFAVRRPVREVARAVLAGSLLLNR